jgi:hypothetical protein
MAARKSAAVLCLVTGESGHQLSQPSEPEKGEFPPPKVRELGEYHRLEDALGSKAKTHIRLLYHRTVISPLSVTLAA